MRNSKTTVDDNGVLVNGVFMSKDDLSAFGVEPPYTVVQNGQIIKINGTDMTLSYTTRAKRKGNVVVWALAVFFGAIWCATAWELL